MGTIRGSWAEADGLYYHPNTPVSTEELRPRTGAREGSPNHVGSIPGLRVGSVGDAAMISTQIPNLTDRAYASLRRRAFRDVALKTPPPPLQDNSGRKIVCAHCGQSVQEVADLQRLNDGAPVHVVCLAFGGASD